MAEKKVTNEVCVHCGGSIQIDGEEIIKQIYPGNEDCKHSFQDIKVLSERQLEGHRKYNI
jgi:hypothetical protein